MENLRLFTFPHDQLKDRLEPALQRVLRDLSSPNSKRCYRAAAARFFAWHERVHPGELPTVDTVGEYKDALMQPQDSNRHKPESPASINAALSVIRQVARKAVQLKILAADVSAEIREIKRVPKRGVRQGHWHGVETIDRMMGAALARGGLRGLRDRAILATLYGSGLRRTELARLSTTHLQRLPPVGRWAVVNMEGKGNRTRTVDIAEWTHAAIQQWIEAAGIASGVIFRRMTRHGTVLSQPLNGDSIGRIVAEYSDAIHDTVRAHDLRRTFALNSWEHGADIHQLQLTLGHASMETTMGYLGGSQDHRHAPADCLPVPASMQMPQKKPPASVRQAQAAKAGHR